MDLADQADRPVSFPLPNVPTESVPPDVHMRRYTFKQWPPHTAERRLRRKRQLPRASQACEACAIAKARCDNDESCQRCRKRNIPCLRPSHMEMADGGAVNKLQNHRQAAQQGSTFPSDHQEVEDATPIRRRHRGPQGYKQIPEQAWYPGSHNSMRFGFPISSFHGLTLSAWQKQSIM